MTLHKLILTNFKSYHGTHTIGPFDSFTCIIGPNGSGKSNIMDAICFVLGVSTANLRADNLTDLVNCKSKGEECSVTMVLLDSNKNNSNEKNIKMNNYGVNNNTISNSAVNNTEIKNMSVNNIEVKNSENNNIKLHNLSDNNIYTFNSTVILKRTITNSKSSFYINTTKTDPKSYSTYLATLNILTKSLNFLIFQHDLTTIYRSPLYLTNIIEEVSGSSNLKLQYENTKTKSDKLFSECKDKLEDKKVCERRIRDMKENRRAVARFKDMLKIKDDIACMFILAELRDLHNVYFEYDSKIKSLEMLREDYRNKISENDLSEKRDTVMKMQRDILVREGDIERVQGEIRREAKRMIEEEVMRKMAEKERGVCEVKKKVLGEKQNIRKGFVEEMENVERMYQVFVNQFSNNANDDNTKIKDKDVYYLDDLVEEEYKNLESIFMQQTFNEKSSINNLKVKIKPKTEKLKYINKKTVELETDTSQINQKLTNFIAKKQSLNNQIFENKEMISFYDTKRKSGYEKYTNLVQEEKDLNNKLSGIFKELVDLKHTRRESERKMRMFNVIEDLKNEYPGVYGRFVDLVEPTQKIYEVGLSVVIGGLENGVVVEDERVAVECIGYLKRKRLERLTFLPINGLGRNKRIDSTRVRGCVYARDAVTHDKKYGNVVDFVLGDALICESVERAREIKYLNNDKENSYNNNNRENSHKNKIATLDGILFHRNGNITGGRMNSKFESRNTEQLIKSKTEIVEKLKDISTFKSNFGHIEIANEKIAELGDEIKNLELNIAEETSKIDFLNDKIENNKRLAHELDLEKDEIYREIKNEEKMIKDLEGRIKEVEKEVYKSFKHPIESFRRFYEDRNILMKKKRNEYEELCIKYTSKIKILDGEINRLRNEIENIEKSYVKYVNKSDEDLRGKLCLMLDELNDMKKKFRSEKKIFDLENGKINSIAKKLEGVNTSILEVKSENMRVGQEIEDILRRMRMEELKIPIINRDDNKKENKISNKCKIKNIIETKVDKNIIEGDQKIFEGDGSFGLSMLNIGEKRRTNELGEIKDESEDSMDKMENHKRVNNKENIVYINMNNTMFDFKNIDIRHILSIIDFSRVKESVSFYKKEYVRVSQELENNIPTKSHEKSNIQQQYSRINIDYDDLRKSALEARDEFNKVKQERTRLFIECYNKINNYISQIYQFLTKQDDSEGNAYLVLENNTEPYKGGVKYYVMPPKKRFREMCLLSGGERTMASLALLFAVHTFRPAPFYVFDEMDSALDKINVRRVVDFIRSRCGDNKCEGISGDETGIFHGFKARFVVITLKSGVFGESDGLVGVYKNNESSKILTYKL